MKSHFDPGISRILGLILLLFAGTALAVEDNWPPSGQIPAGWATAQGANFGWNVASDTTNGGSAFSLKSAPMVDDSNAPADQRQVAGIEVGGTFNAGTISFAYRVSSEQSFDWLEFYIDGTPQLQQPSGEVAWNTVSFPVSAGAHVFRWVYSKDNSVSLGSDAAWIDTVVLPAGSIQQQLAVARDGTGNGTVVSNPAGITCGGICTGFFTASSIVTLSASPGPGSVFAGWSGACAGTGACQVTMNAAKSVTATFNLNDDNFPAGGAIPAGWSMPTDGSSALPWKVATDSTFRGTYSLKSGAITDSQASAIQVTATVVDGTVDFAYRVSSEDTYDTFAFYIDDVIQFFPKSGEIPWTTVSVPVTAGTHVFKFVYLKDDSTSAGSDAAWIDSVVLPTGSSTKLLTITGAGTGAGTVTSSPAGISCGSTCAAFFNTGSSVTLTASPSNGSSFVGWAGACTGSQFTCQVTMDAAKDVTATFNVVGQPALQVSKSGTGSGTVTSSPAGISCGSTCSSTFPVNSLVTLTAAPSSGSAFAGWSGACAGTSTTCQVTMDSAKTVNASFTVTNTSLTVQKTGTGSGTVTSSPAGIDCGATCSATFTSGTTVTLTAAPASGFIFSGWSGACSGAQLTCQVTMDSAKGVIATFSPPGTSLLAVTLQGTGTGTVTSSPAGISCGGTCSSSFTTNSTVTLTAAPSSGSTFSGWSGSCSGTSTTCQVLMSAAQSVQATFTLVGNQSFVLSVTKAGSGSGTVTSNVGGINCGATCSATFPGGTVVTLSAVANSGSVFSSWTNGCVGSTTTCQVTVDAAKTVVATFSIPTASGPLDIDGSNPGSKYDALTDGLLIIRYLFALTGNPLTNGALGATATRTDPVAVKAYLDSIRPQLDVDGNGTADALTDGLLIMRYLFGSRSGTHRRAVAGNATRTSAQIEQYILSLMP